MTNVCVFFSTLGPCLNVLFLVFDDRSVLAEWLHLEDLFIRPKINK